MLVVDRLSSPMTLVWLIYFSFAELLSLGPSKASSCILISEEANGENYSGDYACASMHEAIFRFARYVLDNASHDNIIAFGTILIATFTYVLYRSTTKLWDAGERQLAHAQSESRSAEFQRKVQFDQMSEQIAALQRSAEAAEDSARETRSLVWNAQVTAIRQLRAYVGPKSVGFERVLNPFLPVRVQIVIENFGNTPALNYQTDIRLSLRENPLTTPFTPHQRNFREGGGQTLMPRNESVVICELNLGNQTAAATTIQAIESGHCAIYAEGQITYRDTFGNPRYTSIRKLASGNRIATGSPFINADEGNDSDENSAGLSQPT